MGRPTCSRRETIARLVEANRIVRGDDLAVRVADERAREFSAISLRTIAGLVSA
jgi:hypothetical protein